MCSPTSFQLGLHHSQFRSLPLPHRQQFWSGVCRGTFRREEDPRASKGNIIPVGAVRSRSAEVLFQPSFFGKEFCGIHVTTFQCIVKCNVDFCWDLNAIVVLTVGTTMFRGLGLHRQESQWYPRHAYPAHPGMGAWHPQGLVRRCRVVKCHHHCSGGSAKGRPRSCLRWYSPRRKSRWWLHKPDNSV